MEDSCTLRPGGVAVVGIVGAGETESASGGIGFRGFVN